MKALKKAASLQFTWNPSPLQNLCYYHQDLHPAGILAKQLRFQVVFLGWCLPGCSYTIPLPGRIDIWIVDHGIPSTKKHQWELSEQLEKLSQLVHVLILRGTWSTNKNWAVEKEILELEDLCLGVLGIASFDMGFLMVFFSVDGFSCRQGTNTHRNIAPVFLYIPFQISPPPPGNLTRFLKKERNYFIFQLSKFSRG